MNIEFFFCYFEKNILKKKSKLKRIFNEAVKKIRNGPISLLMVCIRDIERFLALFSKSTLQSKASLKKKN